MKVSVTKDEVKITEFSQVNQGDYKVNVCTFILPECFSGLSVTAIFNGIPVPIADNRCYIPGLENGNCILGVYAYKQEDGETKLMYSPKPAVFYVDKGSFTTDIDTESLPKVFDYEVYCNMLKDFWEQLVDENGGACDKNNIFKSINLPLTLTNYAYVYENEQCVKKTEAEGGFSPIIRCPKYLGFRIEDDETRIYLYIGTLNENGEFVLNENYHINTTSTGEINYLRDTHNRFIETDGEQYFYYKIAKGDKVSLVGSDTFPQGESNIIATTPNFVSNDGSLHIEGANYYSVVLPSECFYAILNRSKASDFEEHPFNVSYERADHTVNVTMGASFGFIPENVGATLLRLPRECKLNDLCIYTDKAVKSNSDSGRRAVAKKIGEKIIKDFSFESQKEIFWNDSTRPMSLGRRFYGVPYSSRWVNSHYVGFEVTPETALNALNDPYSIAYDGGFVAEGTRATTVSGHTEISTSGGTGYGLVCSAFTSLIAGNPYPQSNRGYTFDSNYVLENTTDMNSGEILANKGLSHCVFVDEIYDKGYSLYEAVDPCVAKTTHTCPPEIPSYAGSKVRTDTLDAYAYSVTNKDICGYDKLTDHKLKALLNFDVASANGSVRPWRGNKAVYGSWDITPKESGRDFGGSGIGVTIHNGVTSFDIIKPSGNAVTVNVDEGSHYADISAYVTENGTYTLDGKDGTAPEKFRFYNHDTVQLTFDAEGKAVFKSSDGSIAEDVEYIYVKVKGFGGSFGKDEGLNPNESGAMVIAKGKCYPDLALDPSRITDVRAAIVSDITTDSTLTESWGKYSCATSPEVESEYKKGLYTTEDVVAPYEYTVATGYINDNLNGEVTNLTNPKYKYTESFFSQEDFSSCIFSVPSGVTCYIYRYDENRNFIIKSKMLNGSVLNKLDNPYMRVGAYTSGAELSEKDFRSLFDIKKKSVALVPKKSELHSLNVVTFGDSITYYDGKNFGSAHMENGITSKGYQTHIRERLGCNVDNQGVSGYNMPEILGVIKGYDFTSTDIVTITSGANDHNDITSGTEKLGSIAPIGSVFDENSFYGALQSAIEYILAQNINIKIVLITAIKGWFASGIMPETYANAFKELGKLYSLPVCDWYNESGINDITKSVYIGDITASGKYLHPTNAGYERMADVLVPFIQTHC